MVTVQKGARARLRPVPVPGSSPWPPTYTRDRLSDGLWRVEVRCPTCGSGYAYDTTSPDDLPTDAYCDEHQPATAQAGIDTSLAAAPAAEYGTKQQPPDLTGA